MLRYPVAATHGPMMAADRELRAHELEVGGVMIALEPVMAHGADPTLRVRSS